MTKPEFFRFMSARKLAVVGSVGPAGEPQSALVGIAVTEELEVIFDTLKTTRKYRNLTADSRASIAIGWEGEQTVQLEGEAFLPKDEALTQYKNTLLRKVAGRAESSELAGACLLRSSSEMDQV